VIGQPAGSARRDWRGRRTEIAGLRLAAQFRQPDCARTPPRPRSSYRRRGPGRCDRMDLILG
jgi:hypothetical protein